MLFKTVLETFLLKCQEVINNHDFLRNALLYSIQICTAGLLSRNKMWLYQIIPKRIEDLHRETWHNQEEQIKDTDWDLNLFLQEILKNLHISNYCFPGN